MSYVSNYDWKEVLLYYMVVQLLEESFINVAVGNIADDLARYT